MVVAIYIIACVAVLAESKRHHHTAIILQQASMQHDSRMEGAEAEQSGIIHVTAVHTAIMRRKDDEANQALHEERLRRQQQEAERIKQAQIQEAEQHQQQKLHYDTHKQDCQVEEDWNSWGACSAPCGGGVRTAVLERRRILRHADNFGYGKSCPPECTSAETCRQRMYQSCAHEMCPRECSFVDLGSPLPGPGTAADWKFQTMEPTAVAQEDCVFQFWQALPGPRLKLLGETLPVDRGAKEVYQFSSSEDSELLMIHANDSVVAHSNVLLGFRGCDLKRRDGRSATEVVDDSVARICFRGASAYHPNFQSDLDKGQRNFLSEARRQSRHVAGQLANYAAVADGVAASDKVLIGKKLSAEGELLSTESQFELSVEMRVTPPAPPLLEAAYEQEDDIVLDIEAHAENNGDPVQSVAVSLRKLFGPLSHARSLSKCAFIELPKCRDSQQPCVDDGFVLKNLPFATRFEVQVASNNAAGQSKGTYGIISTRARSKRPLHTCRVSEWICGDASVAENVYPEETDPECQLNTKALPVCRRKFNKNKCHGKKYWETCVPLMKGQFTDPACAQVNGKFPQTICTHVAEQVDNSSSTSGTQRCEKPGCKKAAFPWLGTTKNCCCTPGKESDPEESDPEEGSPHCACTKQSCAELGLADAADPAASCRH
mmetsp:Transcript_90689/g.156821  ORF Transcript_90689/g.156821 Transcript_90689/m.156821 type:complete len:660 (-) Transcript_90689:103-2082(-)